MASESRRVIAADHPCLAGHFPGNPIVPGVVILDEVIRAFEAAHSGRRLLGVPVAKFLLPLRPEQAFAIRFSGATGDKVRFECLRDDGRPFVQGILLLAAAED